MAFYLVQFGRSAYVGRLRSDQPISRGRQVVVLTPRGEELGSILCETDERFGQQIETETDLIRLATEVDERLRVTHLEIGSAMLTAAAALALQHQLPMTFLDIELLHDGRTAVLHGLAFGEADASTLFEELSQQFGLKVHFLDVSRSPAAPLGSDQKSTCGKPDCGEGNCSTSDGCSSGTCSRGQVKSAEDLSAYFLDLRQRMEADRRRHSLN